MIVWSIIGKKERVMPLLVTDHILFYPNHTPKSLCNSIIDFYKKNAKWSESKFATHEDISPKSKSRVKMDEYWISQGNEYYDELNAEFTRAVRLYCEKFPKVIPERLTPFRLNHYPQDGFMTKHIDNIHHSHGQKYGFPHITSLIFLNDDYEGGQFELCDGEFIPNVTQGSVVVFPSNFMYAHEVKKVVRGNRYSVMTWII